MDRYLVVQRIGEGLIAIGLPAGVMVILYEHDEAGVWIAAGSILIGGVVSWIGYSRRDREPVPPFDLEPLDQTGHVSERSEKRLPRRASQI